MIQALKQLSCRITPEHKGSSLWGWGGSSGGHSIPLRSCMRGSRLGRDVCAYRVPASLLRWRLLLLDGLVTTRWHTSSPSLIRQQATLVHLIPAVHGHCRPGISPRFTLDPSEIHTHTVRREPEGLIHHGIVRKHFSRLQLAMYMGNPGSKLVEAQILQQVSRGRRFGGSSPFSATLNPSAP